MMLPLPEVVVLALMLPAFSHRPIFPGKQFEQTRTSLWQVQFLQRPLRLHLQHDPIVAGQNQIFLVYRKR